jgi:hypothetical protein
MVGPYLGARKDRQDPNHVVDDEIYDVTEMQLSRSRSTEIN